MNDGAKSVGIIRKKDKRLIIIIKDGPTYFVTISALEGVIEGTKDITSLWGYPSSSEN